MTHAYPTMADPIRRIVIVGGGQAGGWAAKSARETGFDGSITLIGDESHPPYERPPLSKSMLTERADQEALRLFPEKLLDDLRIERKLGRVAKSINRATQTITLDDGSQLAWDRLILSTGASPRRLPARGDVKIHTLRTIDDAQDLRACLQRATTIAVIGGGWIGLEVAATARARGVAVTLIEAGNRLCQRALPSAASSFLLDLHRRSGVDIKLNCAVVAVASAGEETAYVDLTDGTRLTADVVVAGIGIIPNDSLARECGLKCSNGILVDKNGCTSDPRILAAGDVAARQRHALASGQRLESWFNAQEQGKVAGRGAAGEVCEAQALPWFWSDQYDVNMQIFGLPDDSHRVITRQIVPPGNRSKGRSSATAGFVLFYLNHQVLVAAITVNAGRGAREVRKIVEKNSLVDELILGDASRPLEHALLAAD